MTASQPRSSTATQPHFLFRATGWFLLSVGFTALASAAPPPSTPYSFTTFAGAASIGSSDGNGSNARFNQPYGIAVDATGNLYVADSSNHTIRKINPGGTVTTLAGKAGYSLPSDQISTSGDGTGSAARFSGPTGLAMDAAGNIYVVGSGENAIRKVTAAGVVTTFAGGGSANLFIVPQGVAIDSAGNLYVADAFNHTIHKVTPGGVVTTVAGSASGSADGVGTAAMFFGPRGVAIDAAGNLYVADSGNATIRKISPDGVVTTFAGRAGVTGSADGAGTAATFNFPCGVAIDATGNLYVADSGNALIRKITAGGVVTTLAGRAGQVGHADGGTGVSLFFRPVALTTDQTGNIFVADASDQTVRKITPAGTVSTVAGLSPFQSAGSADGTAAARFFAPQGLANGPAGEIYVADTGNHTIRKISATGAVTTLAGLAGSAGFAEGAGASARFNTPVDVAVDLSGNVFVADERNFVIRKVTPAGTVSTVAGQSGQWGETDGPVGAALLGDITGVAVDAVGNLYVSERSRVRKIGVNGQVMTLPDFSQPHTFLTDVAVDAAGNIYAVDATYEDVVKITPTGTITRILPHYFIPARIALDAAGAVFVTSAEQHTVWKLTPDGVLAIIAGQYFTPGGTDGTGTDARFRTPTGIAVDSAGNVYVACSGSDSNTIRQGRLAGPPVIATQPASQTVAVGASVQFAVVASGVPAPTFQWYFNGSPFNNATGTSLSFSNARGSDAGEYTVAVTNDLGSVTSAKAVLTVTAAATPVPATSGDASNGGGALDAWFAAIVAIVLFGRTRKNLGTGQK